MSIQKEIEFKNLLEPQEFENLCKEFNLSSTDFHTQTNTYFDTKDHQLRDAGMGFRLRVVGERNELTLKSPGENSHTMIETTCYISEIDRDKILQEGLIHTNIYPDFHQLPGIVYAFGTLKTQRSELNYQDGLLVLDRSDYLGHTDYEVEFEVSDLKRGRQHFYEFLDTFKIPQRQTDKKIARFMKVVHSK